MNAEEGIDLDIRRLAKKLFPNLWIHHGVISTVPPPGPLSPAKVSDTAERMSEAVLVFSYTLRPVLQYYMEKHSHAMRVSKHAFWTHLSFVCLRIKLARDNVFDYMLNATAVMAEAALYCSWSHLDDVHGWAVKFFSAFFELEVAAPFNSAGGWAGMVGYIENADLQRLFAHVAPYRLDMDSPVDGVPVMIVVASEALSVARRERIASARGLRGDQIERFEPAKLLTARIFNWDFVEKFPAAPRLFRRAPNVRRRSRRKSKKTWFVPGLREDVEPCLLNSAPSLLGVEDKSDCKYVQRSLSINVESEISVQTLSNTEKESESFTVVCDEMKLVEERSTPDEKLLESAGGSSCDFQGRSSSPNVKQVVSSTNSKFNEKTLCDFKNERGKDFSSNVMKYLLDLKHVNTSFDEKSLRISPENTRNPSENCYIVSPSQTETNASSSPKNRVNKGESHLSCSSPELNPKSLFPILHPISRIKNRTNESPAINNKSNDKSSEISRTSEYCKHKRFSLPNMDCLALMDNDIKDNLYAFKNSIWKDDFSLKKSKQTQYRPSETDRKYLEMNFNEIPHSKEAFTFPKTNEICFGKNTKEKNETPIKDFENVQSSKFIIFNESADLSHNIYEVQNGLAIENSETGMIIDSKKDSNFHREELDKLTVALLLTEVDNDTFSETDFRSKEKNETKSFQRDITSIKISPCASQLEDTESSHSSTSSGICNDFHESKLSPDEPLSNLSKSFNLSYPLKQAILDFPDVDSPDKMCRKPSPEMRKLQLCNKRNASPSSSTDKSDSEDSKDCVIIKASTQTVLFKRGLLGSLAKRVRRSRRNTSSPIKLTPENLKSSPQTSKSELSSKREKNSKKIGDIIRALETSGAPNTSVFKI